MFSQIGRRKSRRIALVDTEGLSVFVLDKGVLIHDAKFSDEDFGHENFRYYLEERAKKPITVLVDTVAEDFLVESLPHVSYYDRDGFLNRKSKQHFRGLEYRSSSIVGRDSDNPKNEKVLFSALTKNQTVEPWLRVMLQEEITIQGITTPAFALCKVAEHFELQTSENILLVNWEKTGIRQTFIRKSRMMFSRLSQVPADAEPDLAAEVIENCLQSKEYLERIGLLKFDQVLDLHIITPQLDQESFEKYQGTSNFNRIEHHQPALMIDEDEYHGSDDTKTAVLLCLNWGVRSGQLANRYGNSAVKRFYDLGQVRRILYSSAAAALVLSLGISFPLFLSALIGNNRIESLEMETAPISLQYEELTAQFPETPIPSDAMILAVSTHESLAGQVVNPTELLASVSQVVARFPAVRLNNIEWELRGPDQDSDVTQMLLERTTTPSVDLIGSIAGGNIASSQRQLSVFLQALGTIEGVVATPVSLPVESGPDGAVITVIDDQAVDANFAIRVTQVN